MTLSLYNIYTMYTIFVCFWFQQMWWRWPAVTVCKTSTTVFTKGTRNCMRMYSSVPIWLWRCVKVKWGREWWSLVKAGPRGSLLMLFHTVMWVAVLNTWQCVNMTQMTSLKSWHSSFSLWWLLGWEDNETDMKAMAFGMACPAITVGTSQQMVRISKYHKYAGCVLENKHCLCLLYAIKVSVVYRINQ